MARDAGGGGGGSKPTPQPTPSKTTPTPTPTRPVVTPTPRTPYIPGARVIVPSSPAKPVTGQNWWEYDEEYPDSVKEPTFVVPTPVQVRENITGEATPAPLEQVPAPVWEYLANPNGNTWANIGQTIVHGLSEWVKPKNYTRNFKTMWELLPEGVQSLPGKVWYGVMQGGVDLVKTVLGFAARLDASRPTENSYLTQDMYAEMTKLCVQGKDVDTYLRRYLNENYYSPIRAGQIFGSGSGIDVEVDYGLTQEEKERMTERIVFHWDRIKELDTKYRSQGLSGIQLERAIMADITRADMDAFGENNRIDIPKMWEIVKDNFDPQHLQEEGIDYKGKNIFSYNPELERMWNESTGTQFSHFFNDEKRAEYEKMLEAGADPYQAGRATNVPWMEFVGEVFLDPNIITNVDALFAGGLWEAGKGIAKGFYKLGLHVPVLGKFLEFMARATPKSAGRRAARMAADAVDAARRAMGKAGEEATNVGRIFDIADSPAPFKREAMFTSYNEEALGFLSRNASEELREKTVKQYSPEVIDKHVTEAIAKEEEVLGRKLNPVEEMRTRNAVVNEILGNGGHLEIEGMTHFLQREIAQKIEKEAIESSSKFMQWWYTRADHNRFFHAMATSKNFLYNMWTGARFAWTMRNTMDNTFKAALDGINPLSSLSAQASRYSPYGVSPEDLMHSLQVLQDFRSSWRNFFRTDKIQEMSEAIQHLAPRQYVGTAFSTGIRKLENVPLLQRPVNWNTALNELIEKTFRTKAYYQYFDEYFTSRWDEILRIPLRGTVEGVNAEVAPKVWQSITREIKAKGYVTVTDIRDTLNKFSSPSYYAADLGLDYVDKLEQLPLPYRERMMKGLMDVAALFDPDAVVPTQMVEQAFEKVVKEVQDDLEEAVELSRKSIADSLPSPELLESPEDMYHFLVQMDKPLADLAEEPIGKVAEPLQGAVREAAEGAMSAQGKALQADSQGYLTAITNFRLFGLVAKAEDTRITNAGWKRINQLTEEWTNAKMPFRQLRAKREALVKELWDERLGNWNRWETNRQQVWDKLLTNIELTIRGDPYIRAARRTQGELAIQANKLAQEVTEQERLLKTLDVEMNMALENYAKAPGPEAPTQIKLPETPVSQPAARSDSYRAERYRGGLSAGSVFEGGDVRPDEGYAWRAMGEAEYNRLLGGKPFGEKGAKRGGYWSWFPGYSSRLKGTTQRPKYLVEVKIGVVDEGLERPGTLQDVTGIWRSSGGEWERVPLPEVETPTSVKLPEQAPTGTALPDGGIPTPSLSPEQEALNRVMATIQEQQTKLKEAIATGKKSLESIGQQQALLDVKLRSLDPKYRTMYREGTQMYADAMAKEYRYMREHISELWSGGYKSLKEKRALKRKYDARKKKLWSEVTPRAQEKLWDAQKGVHDHLYRYLYPDAKDIPEMELGAWFNLEPMLDEAQERVQRQFQPYLDELEAWKQHVLSRRVSPQTRFEMSDADVQILKDRTGWLQDKLVETLDEAQGVAGRRVNDTFFDYETTTNLEEFAKIVIPFPKFPSKNLPYWLDMFGKKPHLLNTMTRFKRMLREYNKNLPEKYRETVLLPFARPVAAFLGIDYNLFRVNPLSFWSFGSQTPGGSPYVMSRISEMLEDEYKEKSPLDDELFLMSTAGFGAWPFATYALQATGLLSMDEFQMDTLSTINPFIQWATFKLSGGRMVMDPDIFMRTHWPKVWNAIVTLGGKYPDCPLVREELNPTMMLDFLSGANLPGYLLNMPSEMVQQMGALSNLEYEELSRSMDEIERQKIAKQLEGFFDMSEEEQVLAVQGFTPQQKAVLREIIISQARLKAIQTNMVSTIIWNTVGIGSAGLTEGVLQQHQMNMERRRLVNQYPIGPERREAERMWYADHPNYALANDWRYGEFPFAATAAEKEVEHLQNLQSSGRDEYYRIQEELKTSIRRLNEDLLSQEVLDIPQYRRDLTALFDSRDKLVEALNKRLETATNQAYNDYLKAHPDDTKGQALLRGGWEVDLYSDARLSPEQMDILANYRKLNPGDESGYQALFTSMWEEARNQQPPFGKKHVPGLDEGIKINLEFNTDIHTPQETAEYVMQNVLRDLDDTRPSYENYVDYQDYLVAKEEWLETLPQVALQNASVQKQIEAMVISSGGAMTREEAEATVMGWYNKDTLLQYKRQNDTELDALMEVYEKYYIEEANEEWQKIKALQNTDSDLYYAAKEVFEEKYGTINAGDLVQYILLEYPDRFKGEEAADWTLNKLQLMFEGKMLPGIYDYWKQKKTGIERLNSEVTEMWYQLPASVKMQAKETLGEEFQTWLESEEKGVYSPELVGGWYNALARMVENPVADWTQLPGLDSTTVESGGMAEKHYNGLPIVGKRDEAEYREASKLNQQYWDAKNAGDQETVDAIAANPLYQKWFVGDDYSSLFWAKYRELVPPGWLGKELRDHPAVQLVLDQDVRKVMATEADFERALQVLEVGSSMLAEEMEEYGMTPGEWLPIYDLISDYYDIPEEDKAGRQAFLKQHPLLEKYLFKPKSSSRSGGSSGGGGGRGSSRGSGGSNSQQAWTSFRVKVGANYRTVLEFLTRYWNGAELTASQLTYLQKLHAQVGEGMSFEAWLEALKKAWLSSQGRSSGGGFQGASEPKPNRVSYSGGMSGFRK
jgi:sulfur relay (sulfurtransferase) DsrC/TusE family protein